MVHTVVNALLAAAPVVHTMSSQRRLQAFCVNHTLLFWIDRSAWSTTIRDSTLIGCAIT